MRTQSIHNKKGPLQVDVRDLPATVRAAVPPTLIAEAVAGMPLREALGDERDASADHGEVELELYADGTTVFAQGAVKGSIAIACSRCVVPMALELDERIRVTYVPAHELPVAADDEADDAKPARKKKADDDDDGVELAPDALDVFPYDGEVVDLVPLIREQFVLAVPFAPLCREDCQGLCDQCGADKNVAPCLCARPVDPRFAALGGMKLPS